MAELEKVARAKKAIARAGVFDGGLRAVIRALSRGRAAETAPNR
jgi:hypothetical protein